MRRKEGYLHTTDGLSARKGSAVDSSLSSTSTTLLEVGLREGEASQRRFVEGEREKEKAYHRINTLESASR